MNKKKIILSCILSLVLCTSLIAGATFALFTSESKNNIAITSGKVEVVATITDLSVYSPKEIDPDDFSYNEEETGHINETTFANGGTAVLEGNKLVISNMTPGDQVKFKVNLENNSNVAIKYQLLVSYANDQGLGQHLVYEIDGKAYNNDAVSNTVKSDWTQLYAGQAVGEPIPVKITLPAAVTEQSLSTEILINVVAVQGNAKTEGTATEPTEIYINDADELMAFAALVNSGAEFANNVIITKDIDLTGKEWTPIKLDMTTINGGRADNENPNILTITGVGNGITISGMDVTGGSNIGFIGGNTRKLTIQNITFDNASVITEGSRSAVVIGSQYGQVTLTNVDVTNSVIKTTAEKGIRLGALVGQSFITPGDGGKLFVTDCDVSNTEITGYHNVAGLVGSLMNYNNNESRWTMINNTVKNCTINVTATSADNIRYGSAFAGMGGSYTKTYTESNTYFTTDNNDQRKGNTEENNTFNILISTADQLKAFANNVNAKVTYSGATVKLMNDIDLGGKEWKPLSQTGVALFYGNFNGNGHTIFNFYIDTIGDYAAGAETATSFFGWLEPHDEQTIEGLTLKDFSVTAYRRPAGVVGYAEKGVVINNCHVINANIKAIVEEVKTGEYDNGDKVGGIAGYMAAGTAVTNCTVTNATIQGYRDVGGIVGYSAGTVTGNTVKDSSVVGDKTEKFDYKAKEYGNDTTKYDINEIVGEGTADNSNTATNVNIEKALTTEISADTTDVNGALNTVISENKVVNVTLPANTTVTLPIVANKDVTIKGNGKDTVLDATAAVTTSGTKLTFENMTIVFDNDNYEGFQHGNGVVFKNCTIKGTMFLYSNTEFINCTFEKYDEKTEYNVWTYGNDATFTNCTFTTGGKAILVYHENERHATVTVENCTFTGDGTFTDKAAVEVGSSPYSADTTYDIIINNCTATGFVANKSDSNLWGNKNSMDENHLNVTIDGVDVY